MMVVILFFMLSECVCMCVVLACAHICGCTHTGYLDMEARGHYLVSSSIILHHFISRQDLTNLELVIPATPASQ